MKVFVTIAAVAAVGIAGVVLIAADKRKREPNASCGVREKFRQFKEKFGCKCCKDTCDNEDNVDNYDEFDLDGNDF